MRLIPDADLKALIGGGTLILNVPKPEDQIKGCSIDLTVGEIFEPGQLEGRPGSASMPRSELSLFQGRTAVVKTEESLSFSSTQCGIAFPPAGESRKGLLMTNPGHVDPGFQGHLSVTVINMGREPYHLARGQRLLRLMIFELDGPVQPYAKPEVPISSELLNRLSYDFVDVERRAEQVARSIVEKAELHIRWIGFGVPIVVAIVGFIASYLVGVKTTEERLARVEALTPVVSRLDTLELSKLRELEDRLKKLEGPGVGSKK